MDQGTAGNTRGQLVGSGVWVQVAEIFKSGQKIQKLPLLWLAGAAERPLGRVNQGAQGRIDGLLVGEMLGDFG
jgi:hypothetical protein